MSPAPERFTGIQPDYDFGGGGSPGAWDQQIAGPQAFDPGYTPLDGRDTGLFRPSADDTPPAVPNADAGWAGAAGVYVAPDPPNLQVDENDYVAPDQPDFLIGQDDNLAPPPDLWRGDGDYVVPDPPDFLIGEDDYIVPDPPDLLIGEDDYIVPDPPDLLIGEDDYIVPDPPDLLIGEDDYIVPDPPDLLIGEDDYIVPDPPVLRASDFVRAALPVGVVPLADVVGARSAQSAPSVAPQPDGPRVLHLSGLSTDARAPTTVSIQVDGKQFVVYFEPSLLKGGFLKVDVSLGGSIATALVPVALADKVTIVCERSKDPDKVADISFVGPAGTQIDVVSSRDVNLSNGSPAGPPTPATPPVAPDRMKQEPPRPDVRPPEVAPPQAKAREVPAPTPVDPPVTPPAGGVETSPGKGPDPLPGVPVLADPPPLIPGAPTFDDLRPPQDPTPFEQTLADGSPFMISVTFAPAPQPGTDSPPHVESVPGGLRVTQQPPSPGSVPGPSVHTAFQVDPHHVVPIRHGLTNQVLGYHVLSGATDLTLARDGSIIGVAGNEAPLLEPPIDPIDVAMFVVDMGPLAGKGVSAGVKLLFALGAAERGATRSAAKATIVRLGAEETRGLTRMWEKKLAEATSKEETARATQALKAIETRGRIRSWETSEDDVRYFAQMVGGTGEVNLTYVDAAGTLRNTFPDATAGGGLVEVKNWEILGISSPDAARAQLRSLTAQVRARRLAAPGSAQLVVLDLRGQRLSERQLRKIGTIFADQTGLPPDNIKLLVWGRR